MKEEKNNVVCAGQFYGGEIEPGTFHGGEIEPGTFHNSCQAQDVASKAGEYSFFSLVPFYFFIISEEFTGHAPVALL